MRGFRVGIVGPFSSFGKRIRKLLLDRSFPSIELKFFEARTGGGSALSEFNDEIVITQPLDSELFPHLDLIFFGGDPAEGLDRNAVDAAREGVLTIVASGTARVEAPVVALGINDKSFDETDRLLVVAHPASILLGAPLAGLAGSHDVRRSFATVMLPASTWGEEAIEELHQQVVKILGFEGPPPTKILHEQLAFNVTLPPSVGRLGIVDETVGREVGRLAGMDGNVSVSLVRAPVFHGYAASVWVDLGEDAVKDDVIKALGRSRNIVLPPLGKRSQRIPSPVSVAESTKIHVGFVRPDESTPGGFWLWVVADSLALDPAYNAILLAEKILRVSRAGNRGK